MAIAPAAGRLIQPADDVAAPESVVVLSHAFGQRHFGDAGASVGRVVQVNGKPFTVIGVTPPAFFGAEPGAVPDLYLPMRAQMIAEPGSRTDKTYFDDHFYWVEIMARLKPGIDIARAQTVLGARFRSYVEGTADTDEQRKDLPVLALQSGARGLDGLQRQYAEADLRAGDHGRPDSPDRVREHRQSAARPRCDTTARDRRAPQHRRRTLAHHPAAAHRERGPVTHRRRVRHRHRLVGRRRAHQPAGRQPRALHAARPAQLDGARRDGRDFCAHRRGVRPDAGPAGHTVCRFFRR